MWVITRASHMEEHSAHNPTRHSTPLAPSWLSPFLEKKIKAMSREPKVAAQTIELIQQMTHENHLWGADRIRGELLKLDIRVCKRTIQKYMRQARRPKP